MRSFRCKRGKFDGASNRRIVWPIRPTLEALEGRLVMSASAPDFNRDGFKDLAIGSPGEFGGAGAVSVLYGGSTGLTDGQTAQLWEQGSGGLRDAAEAGDGFGQALTWGDFNGDGFDDLAIGIPGEDIRVLLTNLVDVGAVQVLYGSASGLSATGNQFWTQDSRSGFEAILDSNEANDRFGSALAAGDFNGDGRDDLAIGVLREDLGTLTDAGAVNVIYGGASGLRVSGNQFWTQNTLSGETAETHDRFGIALAAGDFNGDGRADLAVGASWDDLGAGNVLIDAGVVHAIYGTTSGLNSANNQLWTQDTVGILDASEAQDHFGEALAAGDFNGDGRDDLAIGAYGEAIGTIVTAGAVNVLYGSASRLTATGNQFWSQNSAFIHDSSELNDQFGRSLAAGDFNGDGRDDLAIGVPRETREEFGSIFNVGGVNVIYGAASTGLSATATANQFWFQNLIHPSIPARQDDLFGWAVTAGDYNRDGSADLAIGIPFADVSSIIDAGVVQVLYGSSPSGLRTAGNQRLTQPEGGVGNLPNAGDLFGFSFANQ